MARKLLIAALDSAASNSHRGTDWVLAAEARRGGAEAGERPRAPRLGRWTRGSQARWRWSCKELPVYSRHFDLPADAAYSHSGSRAFATSRLLQWLQPPSEENRVKHLESPRWPSPVPRWRIEQRVQRCASPRRPSVHLRG